MNQSDSSCLNWGMLMGLASHEFFLPRWLGSGPCGPPSSRWPAGSPALLASPDAVSCAPKMFWWAKLAISSWTAQNALCMLPPIFHTSSFSGETPGTRKCSASSGDEALSPIPLSSDFSAGNGGSSSPGTTAFVSKIISPLSPFTGLCKTWKFVMCTW